MMPESQPDSALLHAWANRGDRESAGELIRRHINFVHNLARRRVGGDAHLAADVTQAVFILLLRKSHRIKSEAAMTGWLYTTTRYAAGNAMKMLRRRKHYEQQAASMMSPIHSETNDSADLQPIVHEAIDQLSTTDRLCVVMSYLQEKSS